jgi:hypothetical protein
MPSITMDDGWGAVVSEAKNVSLKRPLDGCRDWEIQRYRLLRHQLLKHYR